MSQLMLDPNIQKLDESDDETQEKNEDLLNYHGLFHNEHEEEQQKYFEFGAHFPYDYVYTKLECLSVYLQNKEQARKSLDLRGINSFQDNFRKNSNEQENNVNCKDKIRFKPALEKACLVASLNNILQDKNTSGVNFQQNHQIYSQISNVKSRNLQKTISLIPNHATVEVHHFPINYPLEVSSMTKETIKNNRIKKKSINDILKDDKNMSPSSKSQPHYQAKIAQKKTTEDSTKKPNEIFKKVSAMSLAENLKSKYMAANSTTRPKASVNNNTSNANNISARIISNVQGRDQRDNSNILSPTSLSHILSINQNKKGRNEGNNRNDLNPNNTKNVLNLEKNEGKSNSGLVSASQNEKGCTLRDLTSYEVKPLHIDKQIQKVRAIEVNRNVARSLDRRKIKYMMDTSNNLNANLSKMEEKKNASMISSIKMQEIETDSKLRRIIEEKKTEETKGRDIQTSVNENHNMISHLLKLNRPNETKSRNLQGNSLTQARSSIYSNGDKSHSLHLDSYHKSYLMTQILQHQAKSSTKDSCCQSKCKKKLNRNLLISNRTMLNNTKLSHVSKSNQKAKVVIKQSTATNSNNRAYSNNFNLVISSILSCKQPCLLNDNYIQSKNETKSKEKEPSHNKLIVPQNKKEEIILKKNTNTENNIKGYLLKSFIFNSSSINKAAIPDQSKAKIQKQYIKNDLSKWNTKSNSINSNISSGNSIGKNLITNYINNKNPTKVSNGNYLNLKKNELLGPKLLIVSNDKSSYSVKYISTPSGNLHKNSLGTNGNSSIKKTPSEKSIK